MPQERYLGNLIKRSAMLDHGRSLSTEVDHSRPRSILLDHGRPCSITVVLRLACFRCLRPDRSPKMHEVDRSTDHGRLSAIDRAVNHGRSIGAQLLDRWPSLNISCCGYCRTVLLFERRLLEDLGLTFMSSLM